MAKKTAIRRLSKLLPLTIELERAAEFTDNEISGSVIDYRADFAAQNVVLIEPDTSEEGEKMGDIIEKITTILEKIPDSTLKKKMNKTKDEIINSIDSLEKAKTILALVSSL